MKEVAARMNRKMAAAIKQLSRLKYGKDKAVVENEISVRAKLI